MNSNEDKANGDKNESTKMNVEKQEHVIKLNSDKESALLNGSAVQEKIVKEVLKETVSVQMLFF